MLYGEYRNLRYSRSNGPHTKSELLLLWLLLLLFCCYIYLIHLLFTCMYSWHTQYAHTNITFISTNRSFLVYYTFCAVVAHSCCCCCCCCCYCGWLVGFRGDVDNALKSRPEKKTRMTTENRL